MRMTITGAKAKLTHDGSMATVHANGPREAIVRLEGMALLAGVPLAAARAQVATAIDRVVALDRDGRGCRRVSGILAVGAGIEGAEPEVVWSC